MRVTKFSQTKVQVLYALVSTYFYSSRKQIARRCFAFDGFTIGTKGERGTSKCPYGLWGLFVYWWLSARSHVAMECLLSDSLQKRVETTGNTTLLRLKDAITPKRSIWPWSEEGDAFWWKDCEDQLILP